MQNRDRKRVIVMGKKEKGLSHLFLREKPVKMMVFLNKRSKKPKYFSILAKDVDCTYSHTVRTLQSLEKKGLVTFEKKGRLKIIELTKSGKDIAETFEQLLAHFSKNR